jgi:hypothetical protein
MRRGRRERLRQLEAAVEELEAALEERGRQMDEIMAVLLPPGPLRAVDGGPPRYPRASALPRGPAPGRSSGYGASRPGDGHPRRRGARPISMTTSRPYRTAAVIVAALALAGCGGQAAKTSPPAAGPAPSAAPAAASAASPDMTACRHFGEIAAPLTTALAGAAADPAPLGADPGEAGMLRRDGKLMKSWSAAATDALSGSQMVPLQLDLLNAGIGVSVLSVGYGDPGAPSYVQTAVSGVNRVKSDCADVLG